MTCLGVMNIKWSSGVRANRSRSAKLAFSSISAARAEGSEMAEIKGQTSSDRLAM